jgi:signal transduction histidine kinase
MPPRILVADASESGREASRDSLAPLGYEVTCVDSAEAALRERESSPPDLVILDEALRYAGGKDIAVSLKAGGFVPVLLSVADAATGSTYQGVDGAIHKPHEPSSLLATVRCTLQYRDLMDGLYNQNADLQRLLNEQRGLMDFQAHDLRLYLTSLELNLSYVIGALGRPESEIGVALQESLDATRKMAAYLKDMLIVARSEQVGLTLQVTRVNLQDLASDTFREHQRNAELRNIRLRCLVPEHLTVEGDAHLLGRLLSNLVDNALRRAGEEGDVLVWGKERGTQVELVVSNTGVPLGKEEREQLFEKFATGAGSNGSKRSGVGLYFCLRVVRAHGGTIRVEDRPGSAVSVVVSLPRRASHQAKLRACPTERPTERPGTAWKGGGNS